MKDTTEATAATQAKSRALPTDLNWHESDDSLNPVRQGLVDSPQSEVEGIRRFFGRWERGPSEGAGCISDARLIEISEEKDNRKWPNHIRNCNRCGNVISLLQQADMKIPIDQFLSKTSQEVRESKRKQSSSTYLWAFYNVSRPRVALVYLTVIVALAVTIIWVNQIRRVKGPEPVYAVSLPEDDYWKVTEWLRAGAIVAEDSSLSPSEKIAKLRKLQTDYAVVRTKLAEIRRTDLEPSERADLAQLVATYNSELKVLGAASQTKSVPKRPSPALVVINTNADSDLVSKVFVTITPTKVGPATSSEQKELESAKTIVKASKELNFTSIRNNEVEVQDLAPNRSEADRNSIQERLIELRKTDGITVTLTPTKTEPLDSFGPLLQEKVRSIPFAASTKKQQKHP